MSSAYASSNKLVLGQQKTESKSNEITTIPELRKMLDIKEALLTIDALACQTKIAKAIVEHDGDYLLAVKSNQGKRQQAIKKCSHLSEPMWQMTSRRKSLTSIVMVENFRLDKGKTIDLEYRYYISSKELDAEQAAMAVREHWGIELMHWVLDVSMNEDAFQI